jgi:hypothetical protein
LAGQRWATQVAIDAGGSTIRNCDDSDADLVHTVPLLLDTKWMSVIAIVLSTALHIS